MILLTPGVRLVSLARFGINLVPFWCAFDDLGLPFWCQFGTLLVRFCWSRTTFLVPFHGLCAVLVFQRPSWNSIDLLVIPSSFSCSRSSCGSAMTSARGGQLQDRSFFVDHSFVKFGTTFRPDRRHFVRNFQCFLQLRWGKRTHSHSLLTPVGSAD